jgi:hypothetical protein
MLTTSLKPLVLLSVVAMSISACTGVPGRMGGFGSSPSRAVSPDAVQTASRAEQACVAQAQARGLSVSRIVGSREVIGTAGQSNGRDVMLRVSRGTQEYEVRCSYTSDTDSARIMSL